MADHAALSLSGDLDIDAIAGLEVAMADELAAADVTRISIDLSAVRFIDRDGAQLLVHALRRCRRDGVELVLRHASRPVRRLLTLTELEGMFTFDDPPARTVQAQRLPRVTPLPPEPDAKLDRLAELARRLLHVPTVLVTLVDGHRQVIPGAAGLDAPWHSLRATPLTHSFCQHVVDQAAPLIVDDARNVPALSRNLAIRDLGVIAYAGMALTDLGGHTIGALCAIHHDPHAWSPQELIDLRDLAAACSSELQLRAALARTPAQ